MISQYKNDLKQNYYAASLLHGHAEPARPEPLSTRRTPTAAAARAHAGQVRNAISSANQPVSQYISARKREKKKCKGPQQKEALKLSNTQTTLCHQQRRNESLWI